MHMITRIVGTLIAIVIVLSAAYIVLMSGGFYTPTSFLASSEYAPPEGKILMVGGNRATGLEIVKLLVDKGEDVTVMVRKSSNIDELNALGVKTVIADALMEEQVQAAVASDTFRTIISTLGTSQSDLAEHNFIMDLIGAEDKIDPAKRPDWIGNHYVIDAAQANGVTRFIFITVIGAGDSRNALPWLARRGHNDPIAHKEKAEAHLRASGLDYTILRPGGLTDRPPTGGAQLTEDRLAFSYVGREDLAIQALDVFGNDETIGKTYASYDSESRQVWAMIPSK
jgi:uncharacterized protein YbjT (DUF2867 family)